LPNKGAQALLYLARHPVRLEGQGVVVGRQEAKQVSCPWLQGCHAWGETLDEAMRAIPGNIRAMVEVRRQKGSPLTGII
jgi:hypothetical protein